MAQIIGPSPRLAGCTMYDRIGCLMRKLALLVLMSAAAQGAIIQINPNEIDITLTSSFSETERKSL
jgi:hypothetical protein